MAKRPAKTAAHSIRSDEVMWAKAKRRADSEGHTMNHVLNELLEGYAIGVMHLPKLSKQYTTTKS